MFQDYAQGLHQFCKKTLDRVEEWHPGLRRPFYGTSFGSMTFNFGPHVCTKPHKDFMNLAWGWCSVTALGDFDHKKGGHLVLWDWKIAVEFPAHSTILIPSAIVEHSNTSIGEGERRQSITQYNSAGLFRWCAYGFRPLKVAKKGRVVAEEWWSTQKHMFSKIVGRGVEHL